MQTKYQLEKWIWTESDFDQMGWHDNNIYGLSFFPEDFEFALDIDYIFQWINPVNPDTYYKFWLSPATLVFENVYNTILNIETDSGLEIADIHRTNPQKPKNSKFIKRDTEWTWQIDCQEGDISLISVGYKMFIRSRPILSQNQKIGLDKRGGISFHRGKIAT